MEKTRNDGARRLAVALKVHQDGLPTPSDRQTFAESHGEMDCCDRTNN